MIFNFENFACKFNIEGCSQNWHNNETIVIAQMQYFLVRLGTKLFPAIFNLFAYDEKTDFFTQQEFDKVKLMLHVKSVK
jgi:hypothetical protein